MSDDEIRPQHDREHERSTLAACLASPLAREEAKRHLVGSDFYEPAHEAIWDALTRLDRQGRTVDPVTVLGIVRNNPLAVQVLTAITAHAVALPDHVGEYAATVREWSIRRQIVTEATRAGQRALNPGLDATGYAASVANRFAAIRDSGLTDDSHALTLGELLDQADDEPDWLIPGLLERRDRLVLTGDEGMGKSHLLRQFAVCAAAGLNPWDAAIRYDPIKVMVIDCENTAGQIRRRSRDIAGWATHYGADPKERIMLVPSKRIDITRDKDLAQIHHELDAMQPDMVVIGPLYRLLPRAIQTDDDAAPVLAALDTIRDRDIALLIEAHSGHAIGKGGTRDMRPRGSSALLGWPEFGYGLRDIGTKDYCDFVAWRGQRSEREWPQRLRRARDSSTRWIPHDGADISGWAS